MAVNPVASHSTPLMPHTPPPARMHASVDAQPKVTPVKTGHIAHKVDITA